MKTVKTIKVRHDENGWAYEISEQEVAEEVAKLVEKGWKIEAVIPIRYMPTSTEKWNYHIVVSKED